MKRPVIILTILLSIIGAADCFSQNNKTVKNVAADTVKKEIDIYKEFSLTSFADEMPAKQIDSSRLSYHLIGVKVGYSMSSVSYSTDVERKGLNTPENFGIYYTYYHSLWKRMPYFGFQLGVECNKIGFNKIDKLNTGEGEENGSGNNGATVENEYSFRAIEIPLLSQFRVDFWKMRLMLGIGPYGYFIISGRDSNAEDGHLSPNKSGIGLMGGGGVAFMINRLELHLDCYYKYALSHFYNPKIYSDEYWTYTHSNQLMLNLGVFFRLGGGKKWKK